MHVEGPKSIVIQEQEDKRKEEPLTRKEEELALLEAKEKLKKRVQDSREANPRPCKKRKKELISSRIDGQVRLKVW